MKNIAILCEGDSPEYEVSINSAKQIKKHLDTKNYQTWLVHIRGTQWFVKSGNDTFPINKDDFSFVYQSQKIGFDCVFNMIHGTPGEDGKLQAYFDLLKIPYPGCDVMTSALTFNKSACKIYLQAFDILTPKAVVVFRNEVYNTAEIIAKTGLPCFIKPNKSGSSCGVSKVNDIADFESAMQAALQEDTEVIIEEFIEGTEVTCGLITINDRQIILPLTEIVSKNEFFDYHAKYTPNMSEEITPARISDSLADKCRKISSKIYSALHCQGIVRIDYILRNDEFYFLEINTIPGRSEQSIVPQQLRVMGINAADLYAEMIEDSIAQLKNK